MCKCTSCNCGNLIRTTKGPKGDPGASIAAVSNANGTTLTLTGSDTGTEVLLNNGIGVAVALPTAPSPGTHFIFAVRNPVTAGNYTITAGGTDVINGYLFGKKASTADQIFTASSNRVVTMDGTTKGGLVGTSFKMVYIEAGTWFIEGHFYGSGTLATPFS